MRGRLMLTMFATVAVIAAGCASDGTADEADGAADRPVALGMCAEDAPDCADTVVVSDDGTGGGLPLAPPSGDQGVEPTGVELTVDIAANYRGDEAKTVKGFLVIAGDEPRLCELLAESYPPQCGGASLVIANPDTLLDLPLVEEGATQWLDEPVVIVGTIADGAITVDSASAN